MDIKFKPFRIGGLEVLERYPCGKLPGERGGAKVYYLCRCLHCGKELIRTRGELNRKPKSCGCLRDDKTLPEQESSLPEVSQVTDQRHSLPHQDANPKSFSGKAGVFFGKERKQWRAQIAFRGVRTDLGSYGTKKEAIAAKNGAYLLCNSIEGHAENKLFCVD